MSDSSTSTGSFAPGRNEYATQTAPNSTYPSATAGLAAHATWGAWMRPMNESATLTAEAIAA